ncbi:MAG: methyltransferase [Christensenellales bacterium]|jgi:predicted RNA methylase
MPEQRVPDALVRNYISETGAQKRKTLEKLLSLPDAEHQIYSLIFNGVQRAALRVLVDACKKKKSKTLVKPLVIRDIGRLLDIKDDKARKTACILIGVCAPDECARDLVQALKNEKIRFVRPSIILALGNTSNPERYLKGYIVEQGDAKHVREEQDALKKALEKTVMTKEPNQFMLPDWCILTCVHIGALRAELHARRCRFDSWSEIPGTLHVRTEDISDLRCYVDALYYIGEIGAFSQAVERLDSFGCRGFRYRIEAGGYVQNRRRDIIRTVSDGFSAFGYTDNPSAYSFEIRLMNNGSMYAVFPGDQRFSYRKQSIPASINPVTAASVMRICFPFMKEDVDILDPFCGSGTMLIERAFIKKPRTLVGVDNSGIAIKAACANRKASDLRIALIKGDILGYGAAKYDEIVANMPFGIRVAGHESNVRLYRAFADKLVNLLREKGIAFLYTQEKKLLRDVINANDKLSIVKEEIFISGGLSPTLFIISRS